MALGMQPTGSAPKQSKIKQRSSQWAASVAPGSLLEMRILRPHPRPTGWGLVICVLAHPPGDSGASQVWEPLEWSWEKLSNEAWGFSDVTEMCSSFKLFYWVFRALCSFAPSPFLTFIAAPTLPHSQTHPGSQPHLSPPNFSGVPCTLEASTQFPFPWMPSLPFSFCLLNFILL